MKVLLYTDNHFCTSSSIINGVGKKYSIRIENQIQSLNWMHELALREDCAFEICLGDFFDKEIINSQELSALKELTWNDTWNDIKKEFIVGNHEMGNQDLSYNSTNALSEYGHICNKPTLIVDKKCNIILIPYVLESNRKPLKDYIDEAFNNSKEKFNRDLPVIILTHNDIKGINYAGFESKHGFDLSEINENCVLFFNGHLHNKTSFDLLDSTIYLIGNLTGLNFSEDAYKYKHCVYVLDTDTFEIREYENPYAFKFYKLEIENGNDINTIKDFELNSVLSIKVKQDLVDKVKESVYNNKNIIKSRIMIIPEIVEGVNNQEIISKDHISQYKEFTYPKLKEELTVSDEIIKEELGRL